jgi:hypothetical protein
LDKYESISMHIVCTDASDHVDGAARSTTSFGRQTRVHYLEFLHCLQRQFRPTAPHVLIVIVETIDRDIVAAAAEAAEREATVG